MPSTTTTDQGQTCRGQGHGCADGCLVCDSETDRQLLAARRRAFRRGFVRTFRGCFWSSTSACWDCMSASLCSFPWNCNEMLV